MIGLFVRADVAPPTPLLTGLAPVSPPPVPGGEKCIVPVKPAQPVILLWKDERSPAQANPLFPVIPAAFRRNEIQFPGSARTVSCRGFSPCGKSSTSPHQGKAGRGTAVLSVHYRYFICSSCKWEPGASRPLPPSPDRGPHLRGDEGRWWPHSPLFLVPVQTGTPSQSTLCPPQPIKVPTCVGTKGKLQMAKIDLPSQ